MKDWIITRYKKYTSSECKDDQLSLVYEKRPTTITIIDNKSVLKPFGDISLQTLYLKQDSRDISLKFVICEVLDVY